MNLYELTSHNESHPTYQILQDSNRFRQYDFLNSMIGLAFQINRPLISTALIKDLNFHAIVALHDAAGQYRTHDVSVKNKEGTARYTCPKPWRVQSMMDDFVNLTNRHWESATAVETGAYALWRLNSIHPFVNGNGRTARALCYYIICVRSGGFFPGEMLLPELIRQNREEYHDALSAGDAGDLDPITDLVYRLLEEQLSSVVSSGAEISN